MSMQINRISLSGWILDDPSKDHDYECTFPMLQHKHHKSVSTAELDTYNGILMQVVVHPNAASIKYLKSLKHGHRVTVEGALSVHQFEDGINMIVILASSVERSETLESLKCAAECTGKGILDSKEMVAHEITK
ncbi:MAG: hypothetical protein A2583_08935 [Bdellovibrionales bacterium RIFOXYD1_FULL_53_11]|nr:MAG: hypothetical protein A2583_08935 [Bdellovibrionales bacterium RIFOXYD1_FULL_53_11]